MLQNFHFKIVHRAGAKHSNVDALDKNLVGRYAANEDFGIEIQDLSDTNQEIPKSHVAKKAKTIINVFIVMETNVGNCSEEVIERKKKLVFCSSDGQRKQETDKGKVDLQQNCWDLVYEAHPLVDQTKTQRVWKQKEDE